MVGEHGSRQEKRRRGESYSWSRNASEEFLGGDWGQLRVCAGWG